MYRDKHRGMHVRIHTQIQCYSLNTIELEVEFEVVTKEKGLKKDGTLIIIHSQHMALTQMQRKERGICGLTQIVCC